MPEPTSRAGGARTIKETGPPVSGRVKAAQAVALAVAGAVALALAVEVAEGLAVGLAVGEAIGEADGELGTRYAPTSPPSLPCAPLLEPPPAVLSLMVAPLTVRVP
jgi:hypothetical protein